MSIPYANPVGAPEAEFAESDKQTILWMKIWRGATITSVLLCLPFLGSLVFAATAVLVVIFGALWAIQSFNVGLIKDRKKIRQQYRVRGF